MNFTVLGPYAMILSQIFPPLAFSLSQQLHIITNSLLVSGETINCTKRNNSMIRLDIKYYLPTTCQFHLVWHSLQLNKQIRSISLLQKITQDIFFHTMWVQLLSLWMNTILKSTVYVLVVLLIMQCKVVLTFESVDEILKCAH